MNRLGRFTCANLTSVAVLCLAAAAAGGEYTHSGSEDFEAGFHDSTLVLPDGTVGIQSHTVVAFAEPDQSAPRIRRIQAGGLWERPNQPLDVGATNIRRLALALNPLRLEGVLGVVDTTGAVSVQVWDGESFSNLMHLGVDPLEPGLAHIALAYESVSGRVVVVYDSGEREPRYRVWDGLSWSAEAPVALGNLGEPTQILLRSDPNSDALMLVVATGGHSTAGDGYAAIWDGAGFGDIITLRGDGTISDRAIAAAWMGASGRALVLWADVLGPNMYQRIWDAGWGPEEGLPTLVSSIADIVRVEAELGSDRLVASGVYEVSAGKRPGWVAMWDGTVWEPATVLDQLTSDLRASVHAVFDSLSGQARAIIKHVASLNPQSFIYTGGSWSPSASVFVTAGVYSRLDWVSDPRSDDLWLGFQADDGSAGGYWWQGAFSIPHISTVNASETHMPAQVLAYHRHPPAFVAPTLDSGLAEQSWSILAWSATAEPGVSVRAQVAAANTDPPRNFVGPDGTAGTHFTLATGSALPALVRGRYFRYRIEFVGAKYGEATLEEVVMTSGPPPLGPMLSPRPVDVPTLPEAVSSGDLDGDGRADLVSLHPGQDRVGILLAEGGGSYSTPSYFEVGPAPQVLDVGDVNRDGLLDVVVAGDEAGSGAGYVQVLLGTGSGGMSGSASFSVGGSPCSIVILDGELTNTSGLVAVGVADPDAPGIVILTGDDESASFGAQQWIPSLGDPSDLVMGDLDLDGRLDLVAALPGEQQLLVSHGGDGGFEEPLLLDIGASAYGLSLGHLDADGRLDVALSLRDSDEVMTLMGEEPLIFGSPRRFATGSGPVALTIAAVDGDCHADVVTANRDSQDVSVLRGDGTGGLGAPSAFAVGGAPSGLVGLEPQDGVRLDFAVSLPGEDQLVHLRNLSPELARIETELGSRSCDAQLMFLDAVLPEDLTEAAGVVWSLGDGSAPVAGPLPAEPIEHTFAAPGSYQVDLEIRSETDSCVARASTVLEVEGTVAYAGEPIELCVDPAEVTHLDIPLDGRGSSVPSGETLERCDWQTSHGGIIENPDCTALLELAVPDALLEFAVRLMVRDSAGCEDEHELPIDVDVPTTQTVARVMLSKLADSAVSVSYESSGAPVHELLRSHSPQDLASTEPLRRVVGSDAFSDTSPPGLHYYAVRGLNPCPPTIPAR